MKSAKKVLWLVALAVVWAGCATPGDGVETRTGALQTILLTPSVQADGAVVVTLKNGTSRLIGANLCRVVVEVREGEEEWGEIEPEWYQKECEDEHKSLAPQEEREAVFASWEWPQEEVRLRLSVEYPMGTGFETIRSEPFRVEVEAPEEEEEPEGEELEGEDLEEDLEDEDPMPEESPLE